MSFRERCGDAVRELAVEPRSEYASDEAIFQGRPSATASSGGQDRTLLPFCFHGSIIDADAYGTRAEACFAYTGFVKMWDSEALVCCAGRDARVSSGGGQIGKDAGDWPVRA
jgi:hypothetical protein